jgi:hypothetical protein
MSYSLPEKMTRNLWLNLPSPTYAVFLNQYGWVIADDYLSNITYFSDFFDFFDFSEYFI